MGADCLRCDVARFNLRRVLEARKAKAGFVLLFWWDFWFNVFLQWLRFQLDSHVTWFVINVICYVL